VLSIVFAPYQQIELEQIRYSAVCKGQSHFHGHKGAGVQFDQNEKELERLSELQDLLHDAEGERAGLSQEGEDTALHDEVIMRVRQESSALSEKIK
jgi:hypothetical protein